ncbi:MAG: hypothetical protein KBF92_00755 [Bacteroidia bacterium]|nr:hypothetical protein [Bacteroidia bacterium]MBP9922329.1 hypothetical protein [Bacteroidia bacterium]
MQLTKQKYLYPAVICFLLLGSFYLFSSIRYPLLNSDNAVTVLMTHYFKIPNDLYFWGQDRLGSLIPLIGQIPNKLFGMSPILSESITHYSILLAGFLAFSTFIQSKFYKIIFAIIWFFPPIHLIDVTQFAFGIHYSLIAIVCYLIDKLNKENSYTNPFRYYLILVSCALLLIIAVWVSDMALVSAALLISISIFYFIKNKSQINNRNRNLFIVFTLIGSIIGFFFISYAKSLSTMQNSYSTFGDLDMILKSASIFLGTISNFLLFKTNEPVTSVYSYFAIGLIISVFFVIRKIKVNEIIRKWIFYFLLESIILLCIIMASKWTFLNNVPRRYFTCTYITLSFAFILVLDNLLLNAKQNKFFRTFTFITVLIGGLSSIHYLKYVEPKSLVPMAKVLEDFQSLGKIGIISEYWNSYVTSCINPELIKATPHDQTYAVRSMEIVEEVFSQPNIYVIKDMWMDNFPDSLWQFNRTLIKAGDEFKMGDCFVCKYDLVKN